MSSISKSCEVQKRKEYHKECTQPTPPPCGKKPPKPKVSNKSPYEGKEMQKYFSTDGIKEMIVPSKQTNFYPITITQQELDRLKANAVVFTERERLKAIELQKIEQARLEQECSRRKLELQEIDKKKKDGELGKLSALEREVKDKANHLLKRAWELRREEEDDVKKANSLILQAKCQAIRDAQLAEHKLMQKELKEEEKRVEQMLEDERRRQMLYDKERHDSERAKKMRYVYELNQQIEELEARRLLNAELLIEERRKANEAMFVILLEELENVKKKEEEKRKTREALNLGYEQMKRAQALQREEDRINDLKMKEYMRQKAEREEKFEKEREAERRRKEIECARQGAMKATALNLQAQQDEMNAVRRQEEYEREWRKKEKEALKKKLKVEEECRLAREQQIRDIRRFQAMEIARDKREFERNLKVQIELQERERLLELKRQHDAEVYREHLLRQINMKERERIEERAEKFQEGVALKAEEAKRRSELKQLLEKKIDAIRQNKVPEIYISEIQRQLNIS